MTMRKYVLTSIALLPLLLTASHAAQNWSVEQSVQPFVFSSEEGGTSAYLGVDISDVSTERLSALKLKEEKGVEVTLVDQDAPAGKAGIKEHDVILTMNGTSIESRAQLQRMIHETPPGRVVAFGLSRDGQPLTIKVPLGDRRKEYAMAFPKAKEFQFEMPKIAPMPDIDIPSINMVVVTSSARSGLMVENLTPQLGEFFGVKNGNGVLVRTVEKGSRAEKAGFRAGDVIVKVNDELVHDTSDFTHAVKSRSGNSISVGVIRDKKEQNLNLALPDRKESGVLLDEESLENPQVDAESYYQLGEVEDEIARVQPEIALVTKEIGKSTKELSKTLCGQQKKVRDLAKKQKDQFREQQDELRMELELVREEVQEGGLDI
jgi:serine protease Do